MPRHSKPTARHRHPLVHIYEQRQRHTSKRIGILRRYGALSYTRNIADVDSVLERARRQEAEGERRFSSPAFLLHLRHEQQLAVLAAEATGQVGPLFFFDFELLRSLPKPLRERWHDRRLTGLDQKLKRLYYGCNCSSCRPDLHPSWRARNRRIWQHESAAGIYDYEADRLGEGARAS